MATHISYSAAETEQLGEAWGRAGQPGLVIGLRGDLGAGKTQLVKGLARGLGISARVHSPTFALVNVYTGGRLPLFHLDLYRLETLEQVLAAGLEEYLRPEGVTVIEWAERWFQVERPKFEVHSPQSTVDHGSCLTHHASRLTHLRWVHIETLTETERRITYEDTRA
jgi:tRNA threonylcarbamoyladenosine biosynthesis protein TsaE